MIYLRSIEVLWQWWNGCAIQSSKVWYPGDEPLAALAAYLRETDRFEVDPVINGKLVLSSSPGGYVRCKAA